MSVIFTRKIFFLHSAYSFMVQFFQQVFWIRICTYLDVVKLLYHGNINFMNIYIWSLFNSKRSQLAQKYGFVDFRSPCSVVFWFWNIDIKSNSTEAQREKDKNVIELLLLLIWKWMKTWTKCKMTNDLLIYFL